MREPVVSIAGCGVVCSVGRGTKALLSALQENRSGLRPDARFKSLRFQSDIVGAAPRANAESDNPAHDLAADALTQAREDAAELLQQVPPARIGLILATTKANIEALECLSAGRPCSEVARRHMQADLLAIDLAAEFGACGLVQCLSVACTSGNIALHQGAKWIQRDLADAVLVVGVDHLSEFVVAGFTSLKAIDPAGSRPFDRDRCGLSPGEAGAAIVLMRGDILSAQSITLRGWGSSNDANHMTGPSRDGSGLAQAINQALQSSGVRADEIDYVNVHGTGTPYNDSMESMALRTIFGDACPPVSGLKGMLGHTLGAAGVVETIACVLAMQNQFLPGTARLSHPAEGTPASLVLTPRPATRLRHILKLNTGFGGLNSALVLRHG